MPALGQVQAVAFDLFETLVTRPLGVWVTETASAVQKCSIRYGETGDLDARPPGWPTTTCSWRSAKRPVQVRV